MLEKDSNNNFFHTCWLFYLISFLMGRFMSALTISQFLWLIDICCRKWNDRKGEVTHFHLRVRHSHYFPKILPPIVVFLKDLGLTPIHRWLFRSPLQNKKKCIWIVPLARSWKKCKIKVYAALSNFLFLNI